MVLHKRFTKRVALLAASTVMCMNVSVLEAKDYKGHWAQEAISEWVSLGIIQGYEDGTIRPSQPMTRAELAALLSRVFRLNYKNEAVNYKDVKEGAWYHQAVSLVMSADIMNDYEGEFRPNQMATREEAAYAFAHAYHLSGGEAKTFVDSDLISDWAQEEVEALIAGGYLHGRTDGTLAPQDVLTRADFITMLDKLTAKLYQNPGTYTGNVSGNVVINAADVILKDMTISGNLYIAEGVGEGDVTLENVKVDGNIIVEGGGEHSIEIKKSTLKNIYIEKASGAVRIALDQTSKAENVKVNSKVQLEGNIEYLEVATQEEMRLVEATVKNLKISVAGGKVTVDKTSTIDQLAIDTAAKITGNGKINKAFINADNVVIDGLKLAKDAITVSGDVKVPPVINTASGQTSGGGGGGSSTAGSDKNESTDTDSSEKPGDLLEVVSVNIIGDNQVTTGASIKLIADVKTTSDDESFEQVTWSIKQGSLQDVKITQDGVFTAGSTTGSAIVVATSKQDVSKYAEYTIRVINASEFIPVDYITLNQNQAELLVGERLQLLVDINPSHATNKQVIWSSSNEKSVKVDETGYVTAINEGEAIITASTLDGKHTATCHIIVKQDEQKPVVTVESIKLSQENMDLLLGDEALLKAEVFPSDATNKTIKWTSSNPDIVSVDVNGKIVAQGIGEATITASTLNGEVSATCTIKVNGRVLSGKVTVENNAIEGAEVLLYSEKDQFERPIVSVKANALGEYKFSDLPKGNYRIKALYEDETNEYLAPVSEVFIEEAFKEVDITCEKVTSLIVEVVDSVSSEEVLYVHVLIEGKDQEGNKWSYMKETDGAGRVKFILPNDIDDEITYTIKKDGYEEITLTHTLEMLVKNTLVTPFKKEVEPVYPEQIEQYAETEGTNQLGLGDTTYEALKRAGWRVESATQLSTNSRRLKFENMNGKDGIDAKITYDTSGSNHEIIDYDVVLQYMIRKQSASTEGDLTFEQLKQTIANGSGSHKDKNRTIKVTYDGKPDGIVEIVFSNYGQ